MDQTTQQLTNLCIYLGDRYSPNTIYAFATQSRKFIQRVGVKDSYTRNDLMLFINHMQSLNYKSKSIHTIVAGVHALFDSMGIPWPLIPRDMHLRHTGGEAQPLPATPVMDVMKLIKLARTMDMPNRPAWCLATVWAPRSNEIAGVLSAGCDGVHLEFSTKMQTVRRHTIPEGLREYLTFKPHKISRAGLYDMFGRMMRNIRAPMAREGFHAIRRTVTTQLMMAGLDRYLVFRFIGWKTPGHLAPGGNIEQAQEIAFTYFKPEEVDQAVYAKHPFLPLWEE